MEDVKCKTFLQDPIIHDFGQSRNIIDARHFCEGEIGCDKMYDEDCDGIDYKACAEGDDYVGELGSCVYTKGNCKTTA